MFLSETRVILVLSVTIEVGQAGEIGSLQIQIRQAQVLSSRYRVVKLPSPVKAPDSMLVIWLE